MTPSDPNIAIYDLLARRRQIAHVWGTGDVRELRPDLDHDQAWHVLLEVERRLDSDSGITWDTVRLVADELYPALNGGE